MSKKKITIRMPKEKLKLWLATLRLPANQKMQGTGYLFNAVEDREDGLVKGYCCLGALQCAVTGGKVQLDRGVPDRAWLYKEGIEFFDAHGDYTNDPYFPSCRNFASAVNDTQRKTFKQIADAIEKCAVGY